MNIDYLLTHDVRQKRPIMPSSGEREFLRWACAKDPGILKRLLPFILSSERPSLTMLEHHFPLDYRMYRNFCNEGPHLKIWTPISVQIFWTTSRNYGMNGKRSPKGIWQAEICEIIIDRGGKVPCVNNGCFAGVAENPYRVDLKLGQWIWLHELVVMDPIYFGSSHNYMERTCE